MNARQKFGFFCESGPNETSASSGESTMSRALPWREFPDNLIRIHRTPGDAPQMTSLADGENLDPPADASLATLEVVQHGLQSFIVLASSPKSPVRVNGMRPGSVSILNVRDQLQVDADHVWHVSVLHKPEVSTAAAEEIGAECPLCRTPIIADQTVFHCTRCGVAIHCGGPHRPEHDRLECAKASSDCPRCHHELVREERFEYVPDV
jgi:hypothetical protein